MSSISKIIIALVVIALVIGGFSLLRSSDAVAPTVEQSDTTELPSGTSTSDESLDQDLATIDANLKTTETDTSALDAGINAQATDAY